jgi:hypothetical protein
MSTNPRWPNLPFSAWSETCDTLHLWTQIVGKMRIATTPLLNHWWNATLLVTARGLEAPAMVYGGSTFDVLFDLTSHRLYHRDERWLRRTIRTATYGGRRFLCRVHATAAPPGHRGSYLDHAV